MNDYVIITGGSSGIGFALAKQLLQQKKSVVILARKKELLEQAKIALLNHATSSQFVAAVSVDISDKSAVTNCFETIFSQYGTPSMLITAAGIMTPHTVTEGKDDCFEQTFRTNYLGTLYAIKACLPKLIAAKSGQIVMISSAGGLVGVYGYSSYGPAKAALLNLAQILRQELVDTGVTLSIAFPGDTDTPQYQNELKLRPQETNAIIGRATVSNPDVVAEKIIRGVNKGKFAICIEWDIRFLYYFSQIPTYFIINSFIKKIRKLRTKN